MPNPFFTNTSTTRPNAFTGVSNIPKVTNLAGGAPNMSTPTGVTKAPAPFVISGLKAAQPGNLVNNNPNTLKSNQVAPPTQQKALGNSLTTGVTPQPTAAVQPVFSASGGSITPQGNAVPLGNVPSQTTPVPPATQTPTAPATTTPPNTPPQKPSFPGMVAGLSGFNPFSNPAVSGAYQKAQDIQSELESSRKNEADAVAENRLNPIPIGDQQGREAVIQNQYLAQQNALSSQGAAQASIFQGGLAGTSQQEQAQSAATSAIKPELGGIGSQQYYSNITGGAPQQQYTIKAGDTFSALAGGDPAKVSAIEQANPGVDPNNLQPGQQINLPGQGGTPFTAGVVAGQQAAGQNIAMQQTALGQARGVANTLQSELQANPQLNSNSTAAVNALNQWVNSTVIPNSPYTKFLQDLQEYANTIAPVLGIGGAPTDNKTAIANQMVPILANGGTIVDAINNLDNLAVQKINEGSAAAQNAGSPSKTSPISGGSQSGASSGWSSLGD